MQPKFISGPELAERYRRSRRTIDRWVTKSDFPKPALTGKGIPSLWHLSDVEAWEEEHLPSARKAG